MNTFESIVTCKKCKKSYTGLFMEDELAMTSDMYLPLDLTCQHCGYDNLNNKDTRQDTSKADSKDNAINNTSENPSGQDSSQELTQEQEAKKQEILARLLAQCSTPPRTELQACTRIISSLESLQANLAKAKAHNTQAQAQT